MKNILLSLLMASLAGAAIERVPDGKASGSASAPIYIEVFSDFQCPSCKALADETLPSLRRYYVMPGKVYLIHRDFPLQMHSHARQAANYANAALRIKKYDVVTNELFRQQSRWAADGKVDATVAAVLTPEEMKKVRALIADKAVLAEADQDMAIGKRYNISQTPTMIVTYKGRTIPIGGTVKFDLLRKFLDDMLSR